MKDITANEMFFVLNIFKNPNVDYNASSMANKIGISSMGALKIANRLEKENIIKSKWLGKAKFYKLNLSNEYVRQYVKFLLIREAQQSNPYIKVWIEEIKNIKSADAAILFGSVLKIQKDAKDIDILLIIDKKRYYKSKKEIIAIDLLNNKKIHPLYQTIYDFKNNIKKEDKPLLSAINGIVIYGEDLIIKLLEK